jgi:hypothetical protein
MHTVHDDTWHWSAAIAALLAQDGLPRRGD